MKKEVKKWSNNLIISFDQEEQRIYGIKEGSILDLGDMQVVNAQGLVDSVNTIEELNSVNASEDLSNVLTKQRNEQNGKPIQA